MNKMQINFSVGSLLSLILAFGSTSIAAPFGLWINANSTNNYSDSSKWVAIDGALTPNGIPGPSNDAYIFDGTLRVEAGGNFNPQQLIMGWESFHVGEYLQTGGSTRTEGWTKVGNAGNQVFNQSGGTFSAADLAVGWINPATSSVGTGVMNLSGGSFESRAATFIGLEGATGTINISGGTYNATGNGWGSFRIADYGVGTGTVNLSGTGVVNASQYTAVGGWGNGTLNIAGGTWNQATGGIVVGDAADLTWTGRGDVNQSGGTVNADYVLLQKGTYNLNGGNLSAYGVADTKAETTGVFNFNGGLLWAAAANTNFLQADTVEIKAGGALIHTREHEIWINQSMTGAGGLVKGGPGILRLTATNSYGGETRIVDGSLVISGSVVATNAPTYIVNGVGVANAVLQITNGATLRTAELIMGWEANDNGLFEQTSGTARTEGWTKVGNAGNQVFNMGGGNFSAGDLAVGWKQGANIGTGEMNLTGGTFDARGATFVGLEGATGTINVSGGTLNSAGNEWGSFRIADFGTGTGTMNLSGSGVVNASKYTAVGGSGNGILNISGGTWNNLTDDIVVGDRPPDVTDWTGTGVVNQSGGAVNARAVFLQAGTYNLDGGVLAVAAVGDTKLEANGVFNFNGGTLQASGNHEDFLMADTVEIQSGGATIDTVGNEVWVNKAMVGVGGLTKKGSGLLKLAGANTYSGSTTVQEGTLRIEKANFVADATPTTLTVNFVAAPADGPVAIFPGTLSGNPSVTFNGLAAGQTGQFSPLSGKATFTTVASGVSFATWSGGQTLTPELLSKYAIGGASGPSAASAAPVVTFTGGVLTLSALVRNNASASSFTVSGEYSNDLITWFPLSSNPAGTASANTAGVPDGFLRKDFSVSVPSGSRKMFLRLITTL